MLKITTQFILGLCLALPLTTLASTETSAEISTEVSEVAQKAAQYAANTYREEMINSLTQLVKYNTVAQAGLASTENPLHIAFKQEIALQAKQLGLDFTDHGYILIVGLGEGEQRLGIITHGDIQPVAAHKWAQSPFELDLTSEPGKLIGRGTEDDKGPITNVLYAMKAIKDLKIKLNKRIELYIYMAEESDWEPLRQYIKTHSLPQMNITLDAEYPVVTAEKGFGMITMTFPNAQVNHDQPYISQFSGGFFSSQIPEDAQVRIENASGQLLSRLKDIAQSHPAMDYQFSWHQHTLVVTAVGRAAHSSKPLNGVNAITHLAELLNFKRWPNTASGALVNFINDNLGTGLYGQKFGDIAYSDDFMGPLTVQPTVLKQLDGGIELNINVRRPRGKAHQQLSNEIDATLGEWQQRNNVTLIGLNKDLKQPFFQQDAPQVATLLNVFSHYTGIDDPQPIAVGGGTNSRLFPHAVSFGPSMPGAEYTGHSEHEFITMAQFMLNLKMYTAVLIELAK